MAFFVQGDTLLEAWQAGCQIIQDNGKKCFNLITEISNPTDFSNIEDWIRDRNPENFGGNDKISDVINTIFPYKFYERNNFTDREDFYDAYERLYKRGKKLHSNQSWGTYFQRLISYSKQFSSTNAQNQLESAIVALSGNRARRNSIIFHLSSVNLDNNTRPLGGPCWQFGEILWDGVTNTIDLLVVYRNHDFFNKTLGNYIGLAKLLEFMSSQSNRLPGKLIIHSANAYYDCNNVTMNMIKA